MDSLNLVAIIPTTPDQLFRTWLDASEHAAFTGSPATVGADGSYTAWDGYIQGRILDSEAGRRILQSWRTTEFPEDSEDSLVEVLLDEVPGGTELHLIQTQIPEGQADQYADGWKAYYFEPLRRHFAPKKKAAAPAGKAKPKAKMQARAKVQAKAKVKAKAKARPAKRIKAASRAKARPAKRAKKGAKPAAKRGKRLGTKRR